MTRSSSAAASAGSSLTASDNPTNPVLYYSVALAVGILAGGFGIAIADHLITHNYSWMASAAAGTTAIAIVVAFLRPTAATATDVDGAATPVGQQHHPRTRRRMVTWGQETTNIIRNGRGGPTDVLPRVATDEADRSYARIARTVLKNMGFDPDNLNEHDLL